MSKKLKKESGKKKRNLSKRKSLPTSLLENTRPNMRASSDPYEFTDFEVDPFPDLMKVSKKSTSSNKKYIVTKYLFIMISFKLIMIIFSFNF